MSMASTENLAASRLWAPWTLRGPTLYALLFVSLLLAASIELLAQKGAKEGGLSLSESVDSIPQASLLASIYLPTFIALLYGLLWSWVDLDTKRIQPWLELSQPGGSVAQNSLFLDYPSDFIAFVPFRAARRRHWLVFYTGTIVAVVSWLITPLQSSIFGVGPIHSTRQGLVSTPTSLVPVTEQATLLDAGILNDAYAITWLNQTFTPPMTADYALLPFKLNDTIPSFATGVSVNSWTWQLTTDLKCRPGTVNGSLADFQISNGRGCEVDIGFFSATVPPHDMQYAMLYVGYYENAYLDYFLEGPSCAKNASHQFLAISALRNGTADQIYANYTSITALFCQPQYFKRNVSVLLSADTLVPNEASLVPNGNKLMLLDSEFNITAFEYLLGTARPPVERARDYPKEQTLEQYPRLTDDRIEFPITNMMGFAIGSRNYSAAELHDPSVLAHALASAHKTLFSTTVARLLSNSTDVPPTSQGGLIQYTTYGIIVSRPISAAVEGLLLVVVILTGCVLYCHARCRSLLDRDPSSISDILGTLQCSEAVSRDFMDQDRSDDATLRRDIEGNYYYLQEKNEAGKTTLNLHKGRNTKGKATQEARFHLSERNYNPIRPSILSPIAGAGFIGLLLSAVVILAYLKQQEMASGGLIPPSSNFEVMQLLENYIPVVFATLLGPFWVLVSRMYCILQPFSDLQKGRSKPKHSVLATYTSTLPQFVVWRSAKAHHWLLMFLCVATILANILALSLGGLFKSRPESVTYNAMVKPVRMAIPSRDNVVDNFEAGNNFYTDHFQTLMADLSSGTGLPSWTDNANFYLPFAHPRDRPYVTGDQLKAMTLGFGIESTCLPIYLNDLSGGAAVELSSTNTSETISLLAKSSNGSYVRCDFDESSVAPPYRLFSGTPSRREFILGPLNNLAGDLCWSDAPWVAGWMRVNPSREEPGNQTMRSTLLNCDFELRMSMYDVTVDAGGNIIHAEDLGDTGTNLKHWSANLSRSIADQVARQNLPSHLAGWHNNTLTTDWINHLLTLLMGNRSVVDPQQELPDATTMRPVLEEVQRRLAATLFGLNPSFFQEATDNMGLIPATIITTETRIFLSETAFILTVLILALYILISIAVYARRQGILLPRMPTSLGSLLAFSVASQAVEDFSENCEAGDNYELRHTYTFGRYIGKDGKPHIGIERDPFVMKLNKDSFKRKGL
ncbi:hypothetical protein F5Y03DRAFT_376764 [Xylaria venustula]|nr:hypothetical protein F5Y03DRAFT_376764 [Xylaria venustula]